MENVSLGTKGDCFEQELVRVIPVDSVIRLGYVRRYVQMLTPNSHMSYASNLGKAAV